jgi:hypothetical protein
MGIFSWKVEKIEALERMALAGLNAAAIAKQLGTTQHSVITKAGALNIAVIKYTPEQQAMYDANKRERERRKQQRKRAKRALAAGERFIEPGTSRTSPIFRNSLPRLPEMSKSELRAMLAEAVRNTSEVRA